MIRGLFGEVLDTERQAFPLTKATAPKENAPLNRCTCGVKVHSPQNAKVPSSSLFNLCEPHLWEVLAQVSG